MSMETEIIGLRGKVPFGDVVAHFISLGCEVVLLEPERVYGRDMLLSAVSHAERAFAQGTNSSKNILTEIILYASGERQISKALDIMRPKGDASVAVIIGPKEDYALDTIGLERDDSLIEGDEHKAEVMGLRNDLGISCYDLALEKVAFVDVLKKVK